jgi:LPXTG-motif cell wall-anchored protein
LATAVWSRNDGSNDIIQSSTSQNGGAWSTPADLSLTGRNASDPQVTVSATGLATAVWARNDGSNDIIQSSTSQNGGAWSTPADLSLTGRDASDPQVTVSSTGLATAVWSRNDGSNDIIQSSTSQNGGAWSTPADLSLTGRNASDPQVTVSSTGLPTAVWSRNNGRNFIIQSSHILTPIPPQATPTSTPTAAPATAVPVAALATTGANLEWLIFAGLLTAIGGSGLLVFSRRKRNS